MIDNLNENEKIKSQSWISWAILFVLFLFMYALNSMMPLHIDDYQYALIWGTSDKLTCLTDVLYSLQNHYFLHGGRVVPFFVLEYFLMLGKEWFNPFNAFLFVALVLVIYWHAMKKLTLRFNPYILSLIILFCWLGFPRFGQVVLWMTGSCVYLFASVLIFAFLLPYNFYYQGTVLVKDNLLVSVCMFCIGFLAGWTIENIAATMNIIVIMLVVWGYRNHKLKKWMLSGFVGSALGFILLVVAPGNFVRYGLEKKAGILYQFSNLFVAAGELIMYALPIIFFIVLGWRMLVKNYVQKKRPEITFNVAKKTNKLLLALVSLLMISMLVSYICDSFFSFALANMIYYDIIVPLGLALPNHETEFKLLRTMSGLEEMVLYIFVNVYVYRMVFRKLKITKFEMKKALSQVKYKEVFEFYPDSRVIIIALILAVVNHAVMVASPSFPGRAAFGSTIFLMIAAIGFFRIPEISSQLLAEKRRFYLVGIIGIILIPLAASVLYQYIILHRENEVRLAYVKMMTEQGATCLELQPLAINNFVMQHVFFFEPGEEFRAYYGTNNILVKGTRKPHPRYIESESD